MTLDLTVNYLLLGVGAGILAGMLGVGGGQIIVPGMIYVLRSNGVAHEMQMHIALGTSLATIFITSLSSIYSHHRHQAVDWQIMRSMTPGILLGALVGAQFTSGISGAVLQVVFGVFLLLLALQMGFNLRPEATRGLPGQWGLLGVGSAIGGVSAIVGVGGGSMVVPYLSWCGISVKRAVATAAACGAPLAFGGAVGFALSGWRPMATMPGYIGYIYWPAALTIGCSSMAMAYLGARLAHRLPTAALKRFFAAFLAIAGIRILYL